MVAFTEKLEKRKCFQVEGFGMRIEASKFSGRLKREKEKKNSGLSRVGIIHLDSQGF